MPNFTLKRIRDINGIQFFDELVIDGIRPMKGLRDICLDNPKLWDELEDIYINMENIAKGFTLPYKDFHPLDNPSRGIAEYELKSKHLRVFCFKTHGGKIIVSWAYKEGKKRTQQNDIDHFRNIKNEYLDSLKK